TPPTANLPQRSSLYSGPRPTNPKSHSDWTTKRVPLMVFNCRFTPLPLKQPLADDQDAWLGLIDPGFTTLARR
ncbi:UDP-glucose/GDP-mannose dehydrogenase, partial [Mycolicibacterium canariasense]